MVEFVSPTHSIGPKVESMMLDELVHQLTGRHVTFRPGHDLVGWSGQRGIVIRHVVTKAETVLPDIDLVVGLVGSTSVNTLAAELKDAVKELHVIGDAKSPQTVEDATVMGATLGRSV
jgi:hypothetical protein